MAVDKRYKHDAGRGGGVGSRRKRRGTDTRLWVPTSQVKCHCPKIRVDHSYLLLDTDSGDDGGERGASRYEEDGDYDEDYYDDYQNDDDGRR